MRRLGIEPSSSTWEAEILTDGPPARKCDNASINSESSWFLEVLNLQLIIDSNKK